MFKFIEFMVMKIKILETSTIFLKRQFMLQGMLKETKKKEIVHSECDKLIVL